MQKKINSVCLIQNRYVACLHNINIKPVDSSDFLSAGWLEVSISCIPVFLKLGSAKGCQGFRETKMNNGGRVLLAVLNLYVGIEISVATTCHSVTDSTQAVNRCFNPEVSRLRSSQSTQLAIDSRHVRRIDPSYRSVSV